MDLAARPEAVVVPTETLDLLRRSIIFTDGAVALVSGRAIPVLDRLFSPLCLPAAGLHGFERRSALGSYQGLPFPMEPLFSVPVPC